MRKQRKTPAALLPILLFFALAACGKPADTITVISREQGSGTRAAFAELAGITETAADGDTLDTITEYAEITNSTAVMLQSVAVDKNAIGYVSLGSLNGTVKAVAIDGIAPTAENIQKGRYAITRSFLLVTLGEPSLLAQDFLSFLLSAEGQAVVQDTGYIPVDPQGGYAGGGMEGKLVISGSSSVAPVMEKLKEAYQTHNPSAEIEIHASDSTTGIRTVLEGVCDIGMTSRPPTDSELAEGLSPVTIATDGIVVIVNRENPVSNLTKAQLRAIFTGQITSWAQLTSNTKR